MAAATAAAAAAAIFGLESGQLLQHDVGAEYEVAGIPEIARLDEALRLGFVRLLDKALDAADFRIRGERFAWVNVSVACRGMIRRDAKGDDLSGLRRGGRLNAQLDEPLLVPEHVVGGEHRHDRLGIAGRRPRGRSPDRGRAVAPLRLEQDGRLRVHLLELLGDPETVVEIGDDDGALESLLVPDHPDDRLEGRAIAGQRDELFGQALAQLRPNPGARSAAHDHR